MLIDSLTSLYLLLLNAYQQQSSKFSWTGSRNGAQDDRRGPRFFPQKNVYKKISQFRCFFLPLQKSANKMADGKYIPNIQDDDRAAV